MARNTESDGTYCSEVEKDDRNQIRRSKRLSQRNLLSSFRSNGDPIKRLYEIYQMIKCGELCSNWLIEDWQSLKLEVEFIQKIIKGKQKGRISFIFKKINKNLQKSIPTCPKESPATIHPNQNYEQEKSPNILAGMMTEVLTEIPPYQLDKLPEMINSVKNSDSIIALTQRNPLDLTKKDTGAQVEAHTILSQEISHIQKQQPAKIRMPTKPVPFEQRDKVKTTTTSTASLCVSKDSMIDLTDENAVETNQENVAPAIKGRTTPVYVSKWLRFLPTQERSKILEKSSRVTTTTTSTAPGKYSKSLKDSIVKLYRDQPKATTSISNTIQNPLPVNYPKKHKNIQKSKSPPIRAQSNENIRQKPFRNTENIMTRDPTDLPWVTPRNVQSEHVCNNSPDFLLDEFLELSASDMNDSGTSLTPSLKDSFRKVFGTDKLRDVFGGDEVVYNLKENHVRRLATALNVEHGILKKTIENILSNDNYGLLEDDNMGSDSSVVECSQSPPQRLFPSQRSQT